MEIDLEKFNLNDPAHNAWWVDENGPQDLRTKYIKEVIFKRNNLLESVAQKLVDRYGMETTRKHILVQHTSQTGVRIKFRDEIILEICPPRMEGYEIKMDYTIHQDFA